MVNGWSGATTIERILSPHTETLFVLTSVSNGCGHASFWRLALDDSATNKTKLGMLLIALAAGKTENLRCENSTVTDFELLG